MKQLAEVCIDFKWQNWFSDPGLSCFLEICALPPIGSVLPGSDSQEDHRKWVRGVLKCIP